MAGATVFKIENGSMAISLVDPAITDACAAVKADFGSNNFTCQITSGALNATANVTQETVPSTWCQPEKTVPVVGETSYVLDIAYLQDPNVVDGLARFLFEHDTERAWIYMGMDGDTPPKAVAEVRLVSGAIGGAGRTTLVASAALPVEGKPIVCFGDATSSASVGGIDPLDITVATFGATPGAYANLAALSSDAVHGDSGSGKPSDFTAGQYVKLQDGSKANFATTWKVGAAS